MAGQGFNNLFFIDVLLLGIGWQQFKVDYKNYDDTHYEVINPDVTTQKTGLFSSLGMGHIRNSFLFQLHVQTPLLASKQEYKLSFESNAPLQLTIGYRFKLSKIKK